jgi:hypothetical protein
VAVENRPRFPLRFAIETGPTAADRSPLQAREYLVEVDREYDLMVYRRDKPHRLGACRVEGTPGKFTVVPSSELIPGLTAPAFYGVWNVDGEGVAKLQDVLLIESPG